MRFLTLSLLAALTASPACAQGGFFGGVADGMRDAQDIELQRRALETDRRYGTNSFYEVRRDQQSREMKRLLEENNRLLRDSIESLEKKRYRP